MFRKVGWAVVSVKYSARPEETTPAALLEFCVLVVEDDSVR